MRILVFGWKMLKNMSNFYHKILTVPDQILIFLTRVDKVVVDIYARFQLSIKLFANIFIVL